MLSPKQQKEYLELKSKEQLVNMRLLRTSKTLSPEWIEKAKMGLVTTTTLSPDKQKELQTLQEKSEVAMKKALTPKQHKRLKMLEELMQMMVSADVAGLTPEQQEALAGLTVTDERLTPEEQKKKEALTKLMLVTPDEKEELDKLNLKEEEARKNALTSDEKEELDKLNLKEGDAGEKALTSDEKKELDKLNLKKFAAVEKALTPEQRERMVVLRTLIRMEPKEKKKYLVKMKATELKEWMTLSVRVNQAKGTVLTLDETARERELVALEETEKTLSPEQQEVLKTLQMKMNVAAKKALTLDETARWTELSNLLQEKK
ncbi:MAG: hypothetical protein LE180_05260 [Endomicrobium sp.]|uniref:hypothetical protein n=1 Tax=Candidatus Endomicrobiellum pyrsonymphae TaxID=1408203 RepID=UPI0035851C2E|nr:hypothetical protein [Endomicrobium sp.]